MPLNSLFVLLLLPCAMAQQPGTVAEGAPSMALRECTVSGGCVSTNHKITLDANWRYSHTNNQNCFKDGDWSPSLCPDPKTCASNCVVEGITADEYRDNYGITAIKDGIQIEFVKKHRYGTNYGARVYLMDGSDSYKMFNLKNREFTMDFDVSQLPCGVNGAMYFVEMDEHGDYGSGNKAGAKYGTGYCDAQCPHDVKWIHGEANVKNWVNDGTPVGHYGACCQEMDIWEANSMSTAYTPHPCQKSGKTLVGNHKCEGIECGDTDSGERYKGLCDKDGCDFNSYRMGNRSFYGKGKLVDTSKTITVVTQFITSDGTDDGDLSEIRRLYVQDGEVIANSAAVNVDSSDSVTDKFCTAQKTAFGDPDDHKAKGGLAEMGRSLARGHVMALSIWDDPSVNMMWLDSAFPRDVPATDPGVKRGPCKGGLTSTPEYLRSTFPNAYVRFTNAAWGEIGSTFASGGSKPTRRRRTTTTTRRRRTTQVRRRRTTTTTPRRRRTTAIRRRRTAATTRRRRTMSKTCADVWEQCGGQDWTGATCCKQNVECKMSDKWYSQCVPQKRMAEVRHLRGEA